MKLLIVESPTKAKTLGNFLGKDYKVLSSFGHVRDLPKSDFGVDIENDFEPKYVIPTKARKIISELKKASAKAEAIILATDEDREGESISWHLQQALKLKNSRRIVFHEITKEAVEDALQNPRSIDMNMVNAQQARRILDRIVGYQLSPFLWKKIAKGLSAGRVQSVAVRLVVEREREIEKFKPTEYWDIEAILKKNSDQFSAFLTKKDGKVIDKLEIKNTDEAQQVVKDLEDAEYKISLIEKKETKRNPLAPFTTSTLQQAAANKFGYSSKFTMSLAQKLYEEGYITYHRTDSLNLSEMSLAAAKKFITEKFGGPYHFPRRFKAKGNAQEAHEAIRPTRPNFSPESYGGQASGKKLYTLIWQRFIASQMAPAIFDATSVEINAKKYTFSTHGQVLKFDGFLKVYPMKFSETDLPSLKEGEFLELEELKPTQHFTEPPPRYNEASLIKALEKHGVGRPSTYAPTLSTIQERNYVAKNEQKRFYPTEMGIIVTDMLVKNFPEIVDIDFTAHMEKELDEIARGKDTWRKTIGDFYAPFSKNLKEKYEDVKKENLDVPTNKTCPQCGKPMVEKMGRFGRFYACTGFPECKHTESIVMAGSAAAPITLDVVCPLCKEGKMAAKKSKRGKIFYGCNRYPACDFATWDKPINEFCPTCNSILVETKSKKIKCSNKECDYKR